jgi:glucan biosynthesis protein C
MTPPLPPSDARVRDVGFDYLRATLTLMVVAHHSALAYTTWARFDASHYLASSVPVVDKARSLALDYAENFNDVFFMSLMFFVSGLFVWPSLRRHGAGGFLRSRLLRLGLPFAVGVLAVMPVAYYASWLMTGAKTGYLAYWRHSLTSYQFTPGPLWFLWLLLLFDLIVAGVFLMRPQQKSSTGVLARMWLNAHPVLSAFAMFVVCGLAFLPMAAVFGTTRWGQFFSPPFFFQISRVLLYFVWFGVGAWLGSGGVSKGLLAEDGSLARHWRWWLRGCFVAYNALVFIPLILAHFHMISGAHRSELETVVWLISCVASSLAFVAMFRGLIRTRRPWLDGLVRCAYGIYLVHYIFVLWAQRLLTTVDLPALAKFGATFISAALLSWATASLLLKIPGLKRVL